MHHYCNPVCLFQLRVTAYDSVYPNELATSTVIVTVTRNDNGPVFTPAANYEKTVVATFGVGEVVLTVTAKDMDNVSDITLVRSSLTSSSLSLSLSLTYSPILPSHFLLPYPSLSLPLYCFLFSLTPCLYVSSPSPHSLPQSLLPLLFYLYTLPHPPFFLPLYLFIPVLPSFPPSLSFFYPCCDIALQSSM